MYKLILCLVFLLACTRGGADDVPAGDDGGIRYPRLGLLCTCDDGDSACSTEQCGTDTSCVTHRCTTPCASFTDCPPGAGCLVATGMCLWLCSTDEDCTDPDVASCAPIGACFEERL